MDGKFLEQTFDNSQSKFDCASQLSVTYLMDLYRFCEMEVDKDPYRGQAPSVREMAAARDAPENVPLSGHYLITWRSLIST